MSRTETEPLYTTGDVAVLLKVSTKTVWVWATKGRRPLGRGDVVKLEAATDAGFHRRFTRDAVNAFRRAIAQTDG